MRRIAVIFICLLLSAPSLAEQSPAGTLREAVPSILFADQALEEAHTKIGNLEAQAAIREKDASKSQLEIGKLEAEIKRLAAVIAEKDEALEKALASNRAQESEVSRLLQEARLQAVETVALKTRFEHAETEIARLNGVLAAKNAGLANAINIVAAKSQVATPLKIVGEEYVEPILGRVVVEKKGNLTRVGVASSVEELADVRLLGAVKEKIRSTDGQILYTLDTANLMK